ncbi:hypothetical protein PF008_g27908 [Phytophthora fragariae]|uniref:Uncharacterized protein n=1 Tax=Phytophthora fragariae TaxID=53985 RepID=A0A6G0QCS9_9STRA|nr:hypothetical protein PF008_g27908 [Phytophthora fragariae]
MRARRRLLHLQEGANPTEGLHQLRGHSSLLQELSKSYEDPDV